MSQKVKFEELPEGIHELKSQRGFKDTIICFKSAECNENMYELMTYFLSPGTKPVRNRTISPDLEFELVKSWFGSDMERFLEDAFRLKGEDAELYEKILESEAPENLLSIRKKENRDAFVEDCKRNIALGNSIHSSMNKSFDPKESDFWMVDTYTDRKGYHTGAAILIFDRDFDEESVKEFYKRLVGPERLRKVYGSDFYGEAHFSPINKLSKVRECAKKMPQIFIPVTIKVLNKR